MTTKPAIRKFFAGTILCFALLNAKAQTINDAFASIADTTGQNNIFTIVVSDSTGIAQIETKIGSESGNSDLLSHVFDFDSQPGAPYSYFRNGNTLKIGIGTISQNGIYYGECRLKYSNGSWSSSFLFINN